MAICPYLTIFKLILSDTSHITTTALETLVAHRGQRCLSLATIHGGGGGGKLQEASVRFDVTLPPGHFQKGGRRRRSI
jgi:hypothetical protein